MQPVQNPCHFDFSDTLARTSAEKDLPVIKRLQLAKSHMILFVKRKSPSTINMVKKITGKKSLPSESHEVFEDLNLEPGDLVVVKSMEEVQKTLDSRGKTLGLYFMSNMEQFCGKEFRVLKKVKKIMLESTGEMRYIRSPTVFLEGVYCDGVSYQGCDRSCLHFWREAWLKRAKTDSGRISRSD